MNKIGKGSSRIITCDGLWKIYRYGKSHEVNAIADVSLEIIRGTFTLFHGPSGSGKTTLISMIGTIARPTKGRISIHGREITSFSDVALSSLRRHSIGFVFQEYNLIPQMCAWENVSVPLIPEGLRIKERRQRAMRLMDTFGLDDRAFHSPEELSGGEQQRVAIARALINDPDIIILDEPTSNIDDESTDVLRSILTDLKAAGRTIIVSSHERGMFRHVDLVFELRNGRLSDVGYGDTADHKKDA